MKEVLEKHIDKLTDDELFQAWDLLTELYKKDAVSLLTIDNVFLNERLKRLLVINTSLQRKLLKSAA